MDEPASEKHKSYSALSITVTASVTPITTDHCPPFTVIHSITGKMIFAVFELWMSPLQWVLKW